MGVRATSLLLAVLGCRAPAPEKSSTPSEEEPRSDTATEDSAAPTDTADTVDSAEPLDTSPPPIDGDGDGYDVGSDCDDSNPSIYPGAEEWCDEVDDDCDGVALRCTTDGARASIIGSFDTWELEDVGDVDGDGLHDLRVREWGYRYGGFQALFLGRQLTTPGLSLRDDAHVYFGFAGDPYSDTQAFGLGDVDGDGRADLGVIDSADPLDADYDGDRGVGVGILLASELEAPGVRFGVEGTTWLRCATSYAEGGCGDPNRLGDVDGGGVDEWAVKYGPSESETGLLVIAGETVLTDSQALSDARWVFEATEYEFHTLEGGDLDGDGLADYAEWSARDCGLEGGACTRVLTGQNLIGLTTVAWGDGDLYVHPSAAGERSTQGQVCGDVNGDGAPDLLAKTITEDDAYYRYDILTPDFAAGGEQSLSSVWLTFAPDPDGVVTDAGCPGDLDGDGRAEITLSRPDLKWVDEGGESSGLGLYVGADLAAGGTVALDSAEWLVWPAESHVWLGTVVLNRGGDFDGEAGPDLVFNDSSYTGSTVFLYSGADVVR